MNSCVETYAASLFTDSWNLVSLSFYLFVFFKCCPTPGTTWNTAALSGSKLVWRIVFLWLKKAPHKGWFLLRRRSQGRKRSRKIERLYYLVKIKNPRSSKQSHRREGTGVGRIRKFPFSSDPSYDSIVYDLVKTKLSELEVKASGKNKPTTMHARTLCDWFSSSAFASDSDNPIFTTGSPSLLWEPWTTLSYLAN